MRIVVMTVAAVALLTASAYAQQQGGVPPYMKLPNEKEHIKKDESSVTKADDKAYKSALDGIPPPKKGYDPWRNVREKPQSNSSR